MRLVDVIFRRGHLSERALVDACMTGERPAHMDRCEICAARAVEMGRWLDDVRTMGVAEADAAFPAERLAAQQAQILRRLEQVDRPARVIAFPGQRPDRLDGAATGIRPAWVAVAAAAGIVLGLVGSQVGSRFMAQHAAAPTRPPVQSQQPAGPGGTNTPTVAYDATTPLDLDIDEYDRPHVDAVEAFDFYTPHSIPVGEVLRTNRVKR